MQLHAHDAAAPGGSDEVTRGSAKLVCSSTSCDCKLWWQAVVKMLGPLQANDQFTVKVEEQW